jgi:hypothetical protein
MDQVMEICDRILDQQPGLAQTNDHKREQHDSPAELPNARRPLS